MFLNFIAIESDSSFSSVASFVSFSVRFQTFIHVVTCNCCSVAQSCLTLCYATDCSTLGFPVLHHLLELAQTHVHSVDDAIQPSCPLLSPSPPAVYLSQHQGLFQWVGSSHKMAKVVEFQLQHQSFQWIFRVDFLGSHCCPRDSQESSPAPQFESIHSLALSFLMAQLSHPYMTSGKTIALTIWTLICKVISLLFNMLSRFVIVCLPRSKNLLILWLQSLSTVILEPKKIKAALFTLFPHLFAHLFAMGPHVMIFIFWMLSFKPTFSLSSFTQWRDSLVPFCFLSLEWCHRHIWRYWCFSRQSWFQLVLHPAQHFMWCTLYIS